MKGKTKQLRRIRQLLQWVEGNSMHNHTDGECCPDYSCCIPSIKARKKKRRKFYQAKRKNNRRKLDKFMKEFNQRKWKVKKIRAFKFYHRFRYTAIFPTQTGVIEM